MVAALRHQGLRKGDRILVQSRNNLQLFESCWVAFRLGCVWVPTNFRLTPPEVAYLGASSGARAMIYETDFAEHADAVRAASPRTGTRDLHRRRRATGEQSYDELVERHRGQAPRGRARSATTIRSGSSTPPARRASPRPAC